MQTDTPLRGDGEGSRGTLVVEPGEERGGRRIGPSAAIATYILKSAAEILFTFEIYNL